MGCADMRMRGKPTEFGVCAFILEISYVRGEVANTSIRTLPLYKTELVFQERIGDG